MSRLTGNDAKNLREACAAIYAPQELTGEQVWEEVEHWVNSLLEEGYDLSEYTWEEMYEAYLSEAIGQPGSAGMVNWKDPKTGQVRSGYKSSSDGKLYANYNDALAARNSRLASLGAAQAPASTPEAPAPVPRPQTVAAAGGAGGQVTVGRQYAATQGGVPGNVTYNAQGQRTFTPNRPAATTTAPAGAPRTAPTTSGTPAPTAAPAAPVSAAPARPSIASQVSDLQAMRAASVMRQNNMSLPGARVPTSTDIRASQSAAVARQAPAAAPAAPAVATAAPAPRPVATAPVAAPAPRPVATTRPQPQVRRPAPTRAPILQRAHFDPFDVVMGYLLDEGYADTEESALVIMANMSEEWKQSIVEGYGKEKEDCVDKKDKNKHNCAKKVCHEQFGEGTCIYGHHSEPDEYGFISHYDVLFEHGVEKAVPTSEMQILVSESHDNHMK